MALCGAITYTYTYTYLREVTQVNQTDSTSGTESINFNSSGYIDLGKIGWTGGAVLFIILYSEYAELECGIL